MLYPLFLRSVHIQRFFCINRQLEVIWSSFSFSYFFFLLITSVLRGPFKPKRYEWNLASPPLRLFSFFSFMIVCSARSRSAWFSSSGRSLCTQSVFLFSFSSLWGRACLCTNTLHIQYVNDFHKKLPWLRMCHKALTPARTSRLH